MHFFEKSPIISWQKVAYLHNYAKNIKRHKNRSDTGITKKNDKY